MNWFFKVIIIVLLLPVALIAWVFVSAIFMVANQNNKINAIAEKNIVKKDVGAVKNNVVLKDTPVIEMFMKKDGVFIPIQEYLDESPPKELTDNPNDSAITKALKSGRRVEFKKGLERLDQKEFCLDFKFKDSYISGAKKDGDSYSIVLKLPGLVGCRINNRPVLIKWDTRRDDEEKLALNSYIEDEVTLIKLNLNESDMNSILKDGNRIRIQAKIGNTQPAFQSVLLDRILDVDLIVIEVLKKNR